jgi:transposase
MRKMSRPVQKVNGWVVGLDVHARQVTFCLLDRQGREVACGEFAADRASLETFLGQHVGRKRCHFALEASGYSIWIHDELRQRYGPERLHLAHARKIRAIANSRRKNDANDAFWLAYLTHEGRLPEAWIATGIWRDLRIATRCRTWAVRRQTALKVRTRSLLAQQGHRVPHGLDSAIGEAKAWAIAREADGVWGDALREHLRDLSAQSARIAVWDRRLGELADSLPEVAAMRRAIPGLGRVLAAVVCAESGPVARFGSAKEYGSFTGLVPTDRSSGGTTRHGGISREGSAHLRWALNEAVVACQKAKRGPARAVGDWVRSRTRRLGHVKKARCAAGRKLAETIWRYFHLGECFDAARAFAS